MELVFCLKVRVLWIHGRDVLTYWPQSEVGFLVSFCVIYSAVPTAFPSVEFKEELSAPCRGPKTSFPMQSLLLSCCGKRMNTEIQPSLLSVELFVRPVAVLYGGGGTA